MLLSCVVVPSLGVSQLLMVDSHPSGAIIEEVLQVSVVVISDSTAASTGRYCQSMIVDRTTGRISDFIVQK